MAGSVSGKSWTLQKRADGSIWMADVVPVLAVHGSVGAITTSSAQLDLVSSVSKGSVYTVVTNSAVVPAAAQIKSGHDHNGNVPLYADTTIVTSTASFFIPLVGLSGVQTLYAYSVHSANGIDSNIVAQSFALQQISQFPSYVAANNTTWKNPSAFDDAPPLEYAPDCTYGQNGPLSPADVATLQLGDNGYAKITFVEFQSVPTQPQMVNHARVVLNSSNALVVPISTLGGLAQGQGILLVISSITNLTTTPETQGYTLWGKNEPVDTTKPRLYVYFKYAAATESDISIVHVSGKLTCDYINFVNVHPTTALDAAPVFSGGQLGSNSTTPAITPTTDNCAVFSVLSDESIPVYSATPTGMTLIQQGFVVFNYWTGVAYQRQTTRAAITPTWGLSNAGDPRSSVSFAMRSQTTTGVVKTGFTVPMKHTSPRVGTTTWTWTVTP